MADRERTALPAALVEDGEAVWIRVPRALLGAAPDSVSGSAVAAEAAPAAEPGRYLGHDGDKARLELRITPEAISGDIFRGTAGEERWLASFRTETGVVLDGTGFAVTALGHSGAQSEGRLALEPAGTALDLGLTLHAPLEGLPLNTPIRAQMQRHGPLLRRIQLELETETGVAPARPVDRDGVALHLIETLARAGIALEEGGAADSLPQAPQDGWSEKQLHTLMAEFAQTDLSNPNLSLRLLWLSRSNRSGLLGVMFDDDEVLPRQGCAVFADEIRARTPVALRDRKLLQIAIHEIGHALNLAHRFEAEVGQARSLSFMNYDWKYRGGGRAQEFWDLFDFAFDADELGFLHHGPWRALVPGGDKFLSAPYWREGSYGYPELPADAGSGLALELLPPLAGPVFHFAQPVILGLRLRNGTQEAVTLPSDALDPKSGGLRIAITREGAGTAEAVEFHPITHRCVDEGQAETVTLAPGGELEGNVNLTYGVGGFAFAEPGNYRVDATLLAGGAVPCRTLPLRLRMSMPQTRREENMALDLLDTKTGRCLALGGSGIYADVAERLFELAQGLRAKSGLARDPVAVNIFRSLGFHFRRSYPQLHDGRLVMGQSDAETAARCNAALDRTALRAFDPVTARETTAYLARVSES
ncbi:hypothetical protein [Salipiger abyssi]|uniref:hypothetical protein n=1 Tax=Salipiger abyssi TaxID=1250539 RepID=UPI001A8E925A|nr:hypothetical protein [Salipiger abyssi]MBN9889883.1 hypothetical protein [Salipiger abyssi]